MHHALYTLLKIHAILCCVLNALWKTVKSVGGNICLYATSSVFQFIVLVNCDIKTADGMVETISALLLGVR